MQILDLVTCCQVGYVTASKWKLLKRPAPVTSIIHASNTCVIAFTFFIGVAHFSNFFFIKDTVLWYKIKLLGMAEPLVMSCNKFA